MYGCWLIHVQVLLMSATLDATRFAEYFGGCPVLYAEGRTFPVQRLYLEDVYAATRYALEPDAPAALRPGAAQRAAAAAMVKHAGGGNK